ncbi:class I SAM-dependent methyltransferase [Parabacteroides merdae]|uniref:Class I SAM-dependent methyltransferase n=1 Tax=Parabacteroides merdae TaxID=46503 RepID=A0A414BUX5_9BACT|nr:class I SAM-dependent methyltransferase [Parabacteroides merdae]RHC81546.1 class I SAM-dependent methyltransferase [Parabacteroides merdae]
MEKYKVGKLIYDGNIYDGLNTHNDDIPFYSNWLKKKKNGKILELCCGTGRLTIPLAQEGYNITGIDNSTSMLKKAMAKAMRMKSPIKFIKADIRTLNLPELYDIIFIPYNSIHHLYTNQDLFKVLRGVNKYLKKNGLFIFDCFNPDIHFIVNSEKETTKIAEYITQDGRHIVINQTMKYENATQINRIKWHYFINGKFDSIQNMDLRLFFPKELDEYLRICNFKIINKYGGFKEEIFKDKSNKQIFVCKKL